jgi:hypothetical protein
MNKKKVEITKIRKRSPAAGSGGLVITTVCQRPASKSTAGWLARVAVQTCCSAAFDRLGQTSTNVGGSRYNGRLPWFRHLLLATNLGICLRLKEGGMGSLRSHMIIQDAGAEVYASGPHRTVAA